MSIWVIVASLEARHWRSLTRTPPSSQIYFNLPKFTQLKLTQSVGYNYWSIYQNTLSESRHRVLAINTGWLPKSPQLNLTQSDGYNYWSIDISIWNYKYILVSSNSFERLAQWAILPLEPDTNFPLQYVYQNDLNPKSDFGKIQDQSEFRIISPNWIANENSWRR